VGVSTVGPKKKRSETITVLLFNMVHVIGLGVPSCVGTPDLKNAPQELSIFALSAMKV
jgi:hypothetical protein